MPKQLRAVITSLALVAACASTPPDEPDGAGGAAGSAAPANMAGAPAAPAAGASGSPAGAPGGAGGDPGTAGAPAWGAVAGAPAAKPAIGGTVATWGQLQVCGAKLCDSAGNPVQLRGVSSMWLNWENSGYATSREALRWMRDNWKLNVIRAAMGIEPSGAYLSNQSKAKSQVEAIIANAIAENVYVIVDWHDHNAHNHRDQAIAFFTEMSQKYGDKPNVLWEPWNEPLQVTWASVIKPYHQAVVAAIRKNDPDNIVILGTGQWSQRVDEPANDPLDGKNLMYTLHFYSCTHTQLLRNTGNAAIGRALPLFVTEWGAAKADGGLDGRVCVEEAQRWHDWMNEHGISWTAWKLDDCEPDSTCLLKPGAPVGGGWTDQWLRGHASFVRDRMRN